MGMRHVKGLARKAENREKELKMLQKDYAELKEENRRLKRIEREHNELLTWYQEVYLADNPVELGEVRF